MKLNREILDEEVIRYKDSVRKYRTVVINGICYNIKLCQYRMSEGKRFGYLQMLRGHLSDPIKSFYWVVYPDGSWKWYKMPEDAIYDA